MRWGLDLEGGGGGIWWQWFRFEGPTTARLNILQRTAGSVLPGWPCPTGLRCDRVLDLEVFGGSGLASRDLSPLPAWTS